MAETRPDLTAEVRTALDQLLEAASTILAVHCYAASADLVMMAIETAAGYFVGSTARTPSKGSVLRFARAYLPDMGRSCPEGLALNDHPDRPLESAAEALYEAFHGGLFHDGERAGGVRCVDEKGKWMLSFEADGSLRLNLIPFHGQFERGMKQFLRDLERDEALAARAAARAAFLNQPLLVGPEEGPTDAQE